MRNLIISNNRRKTQCKIKSNRNYNIKKKIKKLI